MARGGGQKKERKNRGRRSDTFHALLQHIDTIAPPSFFPTDDTPEYKASAVTCDLSCPIYAAILERPVELACGSIICLSCWHKWVETITSSPSCPCYYNHQLDTSSISSPPTVILSSLLVNCSRDCNRLVRVDSYRKHLESKCQGHYHLDVNSPSKMTLRDVLDKPAQTPPTPAETRVAEHLVKRLLDSNKEQVLRVSTYGQVIKLLII